MTEAEWLECEDPTPMLRLLRGGRMSARELRLLAVAIARILEGRLPENLREAVNVGERAADGQATRAVQLAFVVRSQAVVTDHSEPSRLIPHETTRAKDGSVPVLLRRSVLER